MCEAPILLSDPAMLAHQGCPTSTCTIFGRRQPARPQQTPNLSPLSFYPFLVLLLSFVPLFHRLLPSFPARLLPLFTLGPANAASTACHFYDWNAVTNLMIFSLPQFIIKKKSRDYSFSSVARRLHLLVFSQDPILSF